LSHYKNFIFDKQNDTMQTNNKKNIFISYRVKDTQIATGRLVDTLKLQFDESQIFMDIDKIEPGLDFTQVIGKYLNSSEVMLVIIGPDWRAYNAEKQSYRINESTDWVRKEIASALERDIRVIPVLLDGGQMPEEDEVPDDLKPLLLRQAYEISNKRWKYDCDQLIITLKKALGEPIKKEFPQNGSQQRIQLDAPKPKSSTSKYWMIAGSVFILLILVQMMSKSTSNMDENKPQPPVIDSTVQPSSDIPQPNQQEVVNPKNIRGSWYDPNGQGTYNINQEGSNLTLKVYGVTGEQTGSGTGYLSGNNAKIQATIYYAGTAIPCELDMRLSQQESELNGNIKIEQNGAAYSEKLHLERQ
jgi:hypothetical protein